MAACTKGQGNARLEADGRTLLRSIGSTIAGLCGACDNLIGNASPNFARKLASFKADVERRVNSSFSGKCEFLGVIESEGNDKNKLEYCFLVVRKTEAVVDFLLVHYDHRKKKNDAATGTGLGFAVAGGLVYGAFFVANPIGAGALVGLAAFYGATALNSMVKGVDTSIALETAQAVECEVLTALVNERMLILDNNILYVDFSK